MLAWIGSVISSFLFLPSWLNEGGKSRGACWNLLLQTFPLLCHASITRLQLLQRIQTQIMKCDTRAFSGPRAPFTPVQRPSRTKGSRFAILLRSESPVFKFLPLLECSHKTPTDTAMVQEHCHHGNPSPGDTFNDFLTVQHCPSAWSQRGGFPPFLLTPNTPLDNMDSPSQDTHTHTTHAAPWEWGTRRRGLNLFNCSSH